MVAAGVLAAPALVVKRLKQLFGEDEMFTNDNGYLLLVEIKRRLENNIKENYNDPPKLARLWFETFPTQMPKAIATHLS